LEGADPLLRGLDVLRVGGDEGLPEELLPVVERDDRELVCRLQVLQSDCARPTTALGTM
jgi:hypothetical protein